ncbi:uncharacterized protein [Triticum aestivum]|uniref:uncharacterized protein isoform X1 n=1 Tax=Triticum aestivum TaxID=4565 RepID=UPI001D015F58|nr:uncharacterized protein LOC123089419 isoform X1 [Triticum aestivum]
MATTDAGGGDFEFLFPLLDLGGGKAILGIVATKTLACTAAQSSIADVGDAVMTVQLDLNRNCEGLSLSASTSKQSEGKNDPQAPGWRKRCPSMIRLLHSKDNGWYINEHRTLHNHSLTDKCGQKIYCPSHRHIDIYTRDVIKQLRENNISIGKVYNIIGSFFGSMSSVPFRKRALRGLCGEISRDQADDDVRKFLLSWDPKILGCIQSTTGCGQPHTKSAMVDRRKQDTIPLPWRCNNF